LTLNNKKNGIKNPYNDPLTCDTCNSRNIIETVEGFVCKDCGIVLEIEKLEYHKPYNDVSLQYAKLNDYTDIGNSLERNGNPHFVKLKRFQRQQKIIESKKSIAKQARIEISRIFSISGYPEQLKENVFNLFKALREKIKERSKYRSVEKLVPLSIYFFFKLENIAINESELLEISKINKKDFNAFKLKVSQILPKYKTRNREYYILRTVYGVMEHFNLRMEFYFQAKKILTEMWNDIKNTTDLIITGFVSSISILCLDQEKITINIMCKHLGISMSTIQSQVKKRIFDRFKVSGFISLIKSSSILKKIMVRQGIIEEINSEIRLGNAVQVFNYFKDQNYFVYVLKNNQKTFFILLEFNRRNHFNLQRKEEASYLGNSCELNISNFYNMSGFDPPFALTPV